MRCIPFWVWSVWCGLCRLHMPTPVSTHWWTQGICHREARQRSTWEGLKWHISKIQDLTEVPEQVWLLNLWDAFHKRTKANFEHTVWLHPRKVIFIAKSIFIPLLSSLLYYSFYHLPFATFSTYFHIFLSLFIFSRVILLLICKILFINFLLENDLSETETSYFC